MDRELEALLLKALAHDPKDRYPYAGVLAQDIENYLTGEPLIARPPTTPYFLRKRIRKYQGRVAIACSALGVFIGMAVFAYVRVVQERTKTREEAGRRKAVYEFLEGILTSVDPGKALGHEITLREALDQAAHDVETKLGNQPEVEGAVRTTIGRTYSALGQFDAAGMQLSHALEVRRRVLGEEHPDTLMSMNDLGRALREEGKLNEAETILRRCSQVQNRLLGEEHPDTLNSTMRLAATLAERGKLDRAETMFRHCHEVQRRVLGEEHPDTLKSTLNLAVTFDRRDKGARLEAGVSYHALDRDF